MNILKIFAVAILLSATPVPAHGHRCLPGSEVEGFFVEGYKERLSGWGISGISSIRLYVNEQTGTFSVILLLPTNTPCILSVGTDWEFLYEEASHEDEIPFFPDPD